MQYYQFHIGDYISATAHLSPNEDLAYRRMLDLYYSSEKQLPADIPSLTRRLRLGSDDVQNVLREFFELRDDGYHNDRCDEEISRFLAWVDTQRANGRKGGRRKKQPQKNPSLTHGKPIANPSLTHGQATHNPEPITHNPEPKDKKASKIVEIPNSLSAITAFDDAWARWLQSRKEMKKPATTGAQAAILRKLAERPLYAIAALEMAIAREWRGFEWEWFDSAQPQPTQPVLLDMPPVPREELSRDWSSIPERPHVPDVPAVPRDQLRRDWGTM